jgi:hypothetical protein
MKAANDETTLLNFVKSLPTVKNVHIYAKGEAEKLPASQLSPATRRLLIREKNIQGT